MSTLRSIIDSSQDLLRRTYDWTIMWADTPQGLIALFLVSLAESSFFPIPPDVLLIAIVTAQPERWLRAATICSIGSLLGAAIGYMIGFAFMATVGEPIINFYGAQYHWDRFVLLAETWDSWFLAAAAFTPIPFKVATIASGAIQMPFGSFLVISLFGRAARFLLVAGVLRLFGGMIRQVMEDHFGIASVLFFLMLAAGFIVLKLF